MSQLQTSNAASYTLVETISLRLPTMRPSEARVANTVLASPVDVLDLSIAGLATSAQVSEPTVMRFCTAVGYEGYRSFKIALAQAVALGLPVENATVNSEDTSAELIEKVFQRTISSLDRARFSLDSEAVQQAIEAIFAAKELLFLGAGASSMVAQDAQHKFFLFGIPCQAFEDAHFQFMVSALATPDTVAIAISETGTTSETIRAAGAVKAMGGTVIALSGSHGPLSELADIDLRCATFEDTDLFTPTVSRLAALVVIDVLALGVAVRRPPEFLTRVGEMRTKMANVRGLHHELTIDPQAD